MRRTIFGKLITVFFVIFIIGALLSGSMLAFFLTDFVTKDKVNNLEYNTDLIVSILDIFNEEGATQYDLVGFINLINEISQKNNLIVYLINIDGEIQIIKPSLELLPKEISDKLLLVNDKLKLPDNKMYNKIFEGNEVFKDIGDYNGLYADTGYPWLTYAKPYTDIEGNLLGAVIMSTSIPEVMSAQRQIFRLFLISIIISMIISFILIYYMSLKITRPIRIINNAFKVISNGSFDKRVEYIPDDEIGELAISFNQMSSTLENLDKMRSDFMANVSHDLRTPMTSIGGFVEGILDGTIPVEKQNYYLKIVRDEIKRLNNLINNILDLAKMEAGEISLHMSVFNINEVIRRSIIKFENMLVEKNIEVRVDFDSDETLVEADQDSIERVIINLLHNSIKFIGDEERIIVLSTTVDKEKVIVTIADSGEGIGEEELKFIWERFHKADRSRNKDKVGTGLGLSIVKTLIREHGQDIKVESVKGEGAKFIFTLKYIK